MNFCEKCNIALSGERCLKCGNKKLRAVTDDDFCLVAMVNRILGDSLKGSLESEDIECVLIPFGTGAASQFALPLENYLLYVRYKNLDYVRQLIKDSNP